MILVVSYDLAQPPDAQRTFIDALKAQGNWWHYLRNTWLIDSEKSPEAVFDDLKPYTIPEDRIFIAVLGPAYSGWLQPDAWSWIRDRRAGLPVASSASDASPDAKSGPVVSAPDLGVANEPQTEPEEKQ
jgi:hypothetical protein